MCGIWGIIKTKKSRFNKQLFNILGTHNDSRGGDSCGIFIDGNVEYGVNTLKLY
jgi:glucosamine 6-phosphate synthetase-like amidotransferase/phosphosugar isomerase protein